MVRVECDARQSKARRRILDVVFVHVAEAPKPCAILVVSIERAAAHFKVAFFFLA
jgi:hypothetical protein